MGDTQAEKAARDAAEDAAWRDAYYVACIGASNPVAVTGTLHRHSAALLPYFGTNGTRNHQALRAIAGHLAYLYGYGLGPDPEVLQATKRNAERLNVG